MLPLQKLNRYFIYLQLKHDKTFKWQIIIMQALAQQSKFMEQKRLFKNCTLWKLRLYKFAFGYLKASVALIFNFKYRGSIPQIIFYPNINVHKVFKAL